jgi:hypothetical protein
MRLRKMYLVSPEHFREGGISTAAPKPPTDGHKRENKIAHSRNRENRDARHSQKRHRTHTGHKANKSSSRHPHDRWVALRTKIRESDIRESHLINKIIDFLRNVLPHATKSRKSGKTPPQEPKFETIDLGTPWQSAVAKQTERVADKTKKQCHNSVYIIGNRSV